jgi:hypothetical protein
MGKVGVGYFNHLLQNCNLPEHGQYIFDALNVYQTRADDFSEEIGTHFIRAIVRTNTVPRGIAEMGVYENRIGSWIKPFAMEQLVKNMAVEHTPLLAGALEVMIQKGVRPSAEVFEVMFRNLEKLVDSKILTFPAARSSRRKLFRASVHALTPAEVNQLSEKYNHPERPKEDAASAK